MSRAYVHKTKSHKNQKKQDSSQNLKTENETHDETIQTNIYYIRKTYVTTSLDVGVTHADLKFPGGIGGPVVRSWRFHCWGPS